MPHATTPPPPPTSAFIEEPLNTTEPASPPHTIDTLLNLVPDHPSLVLSHLTTNPHLAAQQDAHGYSLLHAAVSYAHTSLLRALVATYHVSPELRDEDGETPLFAVEKLSVAQFLVGDEVGVDVHVKNHEGRGVLSRLREDEGEEWESVVAFLKEAGAEEDEEDEGEDGEGEVADPVLRARIEELAQREDFQSPAGQEELRALVRDAVEGLGGRDEEKGG